MKTIFQKPLILDGAMGTELTKKGIKTPLPLWSAIANEQNYDEVVKIHKCYIDNGCICMRHHTCNNAIARSPHLSPQCRSSGHNRTGNRLRAVLY